MKKEAKKTKTEEPPKYVGSSINLSNADWKLLRRVAMARAEVRAEAREDAKGGRPSVSKVIESLIVIHKEELQKEAAKLFD